MEIGRSTPWGPERYQFNESYGDEKVPEPSGYISVSKYIIHKSPLSKLKPSCKSFSNLQGISVASESLSRGSSLPRSNHFLN